MDEAFKNAAQEAYPVPEHIAVCARAIRYDLLYGPTFSRVPADGIESFSEDDFSQDYTLLQADKEDQGGEISETYTGPVADALREFIENLPSDLYYLTECGSISIFEPQVEEDEDGASMDAEPYMVVSTKDLTHALFGKIVAENFS